MNNIRRIVSKKSGYSIQDESLSWLCFTAEQASSTVLLNSTYLSGTYDYSLDGGATWNNYTKGTKMTLSNVGDKIWFAARTTNTTCFSGSWGNQITLTGKVAASGNIMSLLAKDLTATSVPANCWCYCFRNQTALTKAPELPATTVNAQGYRSMFGGCTNLIEGPSSLPMTDSMGNEACGCMFYNCTSLTKAPELPATSLGTFCYQAMFSHCSSLVNAPVLPASTPTSQCYYKMFEYCTSLKTMEIHLTSWATSQTDGWLASASSSGTFRCPTDLTIPATSTSGVPSGWTIERF